MNDIIDEVNNDRAEEKKVKLFKQALPWIIVLTVIGVICVAVYNYRTEKHIAHSREMGDMLIKAISVMADDEKAANEALDYLIKDEDAGIGDIAMLERVAAHIRKDDRNSTLNELENVIKNAHNDLTKSYAKIIWMSIIVDRDRLNDHEKEVMENNLKSFDKGDVEFFGTAQVLGAFYHVKHNRVDEAKNALQKVVKNDSVPQLVKDQAQALLANLNIK